MTTPSPDSLWVAHHEAGHLVAATLRGIEWNHATIERVGGYDGHVLCRPTGAFLDPQNQAFLFWAGAYAESRFTNRPLDEVTRSPNCRDDLAVFGPHRTRARDREWAAEIRPFLATSGGVRCSAARCRHDHSAPAGPTSGQRSGRAFSGAGGSHNRRLGRHPRSLRGGGADDWSRPSTPPRSFNAREDSMTDWTHCANCLGRFFACAAAGRGRPDVCRGCQSLVPPLAAPARPTFADRLERALVAA